MESKSLVSKMSDLFKEWEKYEELEEKTCPRCKKKLKYVENSKKHVFKSFLLKNVTYYECPKCGLKLKWKL